MYIHWKVNVQVYKKVQGSLLGLYLSSLYPRGLRICMNIVCDLPTDATEA